MPDFVIYILIGVAALLIGLLIGYILRKAVGEKVIGSAEQKAQNMILDAEKRSDTIKKEVLIEAKEEAHKMRNDLDREIKERRREINKSESRLVQKEEAIDKKLENIERKEESITKKEKGLSAKQSELDKLIAKQMEELERISGYSIEEAKRILLANTEKEIRHEASVIMQLN